ncbi:hypothetical protein DITRI_Ditri01bG0196600 [Diplodiscus trichospermus]
MTGGLPGVKTLRNAEEKTEERSKQNNVEKATGDDHPIEVLPSPTTLCLNCTVCQYPCHPLPPPASPPVSGYPSYGAPPPPPFVSSYAPPPPLSPPVEAKCPPVPPQCCQYPSHPNPYEYQPLDDHSPTPTLPISTFSIVILSFSFYVLF